MEMAQCNRLEDEYADVTTEHGFWSDGRSVHSLCVTVKLYSNDYNQLNFTLLPARFSIF